MRSDLYCQLASVINGNYGWLRVSEGKTYDIQSVCVHKRTYPVVCRTLVLRAAFANDTYTKGQVWHISDIALDKAVAAYRKADAGFRNRLQEMDADHATLTAEDAEQIILLATHGLLNLELTDSLF
jgi:hypothetical protein